MEFLFTKFFQTILNIALDLFSMLIGHFVEQSTLFSLDGLSGLTITIQAIAGVIMFYSVMSDIVYKLSGIEGSFYDINLGEYALKIFVNIAILSGLPYIMLEVGKIATNMLSIANKAGVRYFPINRTGDFFVPGVFDFNNAGLITLIMAGILIFMGIKSVISLAKVQVELFIILLISPLSMIDFYKGPDKLKGLMMNVISLITTAAVKILLIYIALNILGEMQINILSTNESIVDFIKVVAIFAVADNPQAAASFMLNPAQNKGGGAKGYVAMEIARKIITKGV